MWTPLLLLLAACTSSKGTGPADDTTPADDTADTDTGDTGVAPPICPELAPPALATDAWEAAGTLPATGLHGFGTGGGYPAWIASHSTGLWRRDTATSAWARVPTGVTHIISEIAVSPTDSGRAYWSSGGTAQRTLDGGRTVEALSLGQIRPDTVVDLVWAVAVPQWNSNRVLAMLESGNAAVSNDGGVTWENLGYAPIHETPTMTDHFHVWGWRILPEVESGGRVVFGDGFGIAISDDGLRTFLRTLDTAVAGHSLMRNPDDPDHILIGGPDGLRESRDEGSTWTLRDIGGETLAGAWATDGAWLALVGPTDLFVSTDAGATFTVTPHNLPTPTGMSILDDGTLFVAHSSGAYSSADRGVTWNDDSSGLIDRGVSVVYADPTCPARVYAGSRCGGGLYVSEDYGAAWTPVNAFFHYVMGVHIEPSNPNRVWVVSDDAVLRSDDGGRTWRDAWRQYHFHGFTTHPDNPDTLLIGSVGSGEYADNDGMHVYRSTDGGETWGDSSEGLPAGEASAHTMVRWPGAPDVVILGTYKGSGYSHLNGEGVGMFRSADGGTSWTAIDAPVFDIAALYASADTVYAATNDGVWASTDEGITWARLGDLAEPLLTVGFSPSGAAGIAVTDVGDAYKTTDGGATWVRHDEGLPFSPGSTLVQISFPADESTALLTVYDQGVYRIGL